MSPKKETTTLCVSNNMVMASYPSADPVHNQIIAALLKRYSDVLSFDVNDIFNGKIESAPVAIDSKDYGISKIRLMEKCEELMKNVIVRFPFRIPGGKKGNVSAPIIVKAVNKEGTSKIDLYINESIIPEIRYTGVDDTGNRIGLTAMPEHLKLLTKPYSVRIAEFLAYMDQHMKKEIHNGWYPRIDIDGGTPRGGDAPLPHSFMEQLGIPWTYRKPQRMRKQIIDPAIEDIFQKTGDIYTYRFEDAEGNTCTGKMKSRYLRFRLLYKKDRGSDELNLQYIYGYMTAEGFGKNEVDRFMYALRDEETRRIVWADLKGMQGNPAFNKHKVRACFAATVKNILHPAIEFNKTEQ